MTTAEQPRSALAWANVVRCQRAARRREIEPLPPAEGRQALRALVLDPPRDVQNLAVAAALRWIRGVGASEKRRLLTKANVSDHRRLGELTARERRAVADVLGA